MKQIVVLYIILFFVAKPILMTFSALDGGECDLMEMQGEDDSEEEC
jgi:hypothetical protein